MDPPNLPTEPFGKSELNRIHNRDDVSAVIPLYLERDDDLEVLAFSMIGSNELRMYYYDGVWSLLADHELENTPRIHRADPPRATVSLIGRDARVASSLANEFGERIMDATKIGFADYTSDGDLGMPELSQEECPCDGLDSPSVERLPGVSDIDGEYLFACPNCRAVYGLEFRGKRRSLECATDEEWLFEEGMPGEIIEVGDPHDYLLHTPGSEIGRLERVLATLYAVGGARSSSFSVYTPHRHQSLVYIDDGVLAGYMTWEELDDLQVIRQIFVREEHRRQGIASELVRQWCNEFCEGTQYHIDEPNEKSRGLFQKIGHFDPKEEFRAIELYPLRDAGNDLEAALNDSMAL